MHPNLELYKENGQIFHVKTGQNLGGGVYFSTEIIQEATPVALDKFAQ